MDSFGVWYKSEDVEENNKNRTSEVDDTKKDNSKQENAKSQINEEQKEDKKNFKKEMQSFEAELNINLWSKLKVNNYQKEQTYLDIGFKIKKYKKIKELIFLCPFVLNKDNIEDLSEKMAVKKNANLIFNNDCEIESRDSYTIINNNEKDETLLVYPFEQAVENVIDIQPVIGNNYKLIIKFDEFKKYINERKNEGKIKDGKSNNCKELDEIEDLYIRFRINSIELKDKLFYDVDPINKIFQSGFVSTQIIDFKLNNKRNLDDKILARAVKKNERVVDFKMIHFLLMEPSNSDVIYISNDKVICRNLEIGEWDDYLKSKQIKDMLVYHWKSIKETDLENTEFNQLVKINYSKTNIKIILLYIVGVIVFGSIGSLAAEFIKTTVINRKLIYEFLKNLNLRFITELIDKSNIIIVLLILILIALSGNNIKKFFSKIYCRIVKK